MTEEQIKEKARDEAVYNEGYNKGKKDILTEKNLVDIDKVCEWLKKHVTFIHPRTGNRECVVNLTAFRDTMAEWLLQNIQIVKLDNAYNHDLFKHNRFLYLEEQKRQLLLSLKDYVNVKEELTGYGTIVKMEIKVMK